MALNLGAALGAAAQSGMNTYLKLGEEQRQAEELAMRKQEAAYQEEQRNQERKLNEITSQTLGMGNTRVTGADYTGVTGGIDTAEPALKTEAYTPQQQMADFKQRALSAGIPLQKVTAVSGAHRAEKYAEKEEMALGFNQQVMEDVKANPTDLGAVFKKHFQDQYNEGKLPGLGDGKTADVVPSATGGQSIVLKDDKGAVTKTIPLNVDTIHALTDKWTGAMLSSSNPANWWKSREHDLKQREVDLKGREVEFKGREVGVKEKLLPSEIAKNLAAANLSGMHAKVYGNMLDAAKDNKEANAAMKPFLDEFAAMTPEDQAGPTGQAVLLKGATAGAQKSKDLAGIVTMLRKPDRSAVSAERDKAAHAALNTAIETGDQKKIDFVKTQYQDVFGEDPLAKQVREALEAKKKAESGNRAGAGGSDNKVSTAIPTTPPAAPKPQTTALASVAAPYQQRLGELAPLIEAAQNKVRAGGGLIAARELQTLTQERDKILANPALK
jgi:hypothetical protein